MNVENEHRRDEVRHLRGCINDLVSLLALPALWSGRKPSQIIETLLDALLGMLRLDFIYARLNDTAGDLPFEAVRIAQRTHVHQPPEIGRVFEHWLAQDKVPSSSVMPNPVGDGEAHIARFSLGLHEQTGVGLAGSRRPDFPSETETLLLTVAANQAAIALEEAQLASRRRQAEEALRASENQLRLVMDNIPGFIVYCDTAPSYRLVNKGYAQRFGITLEEVMGKRISEVLGEEAYACIRPTCMEC